MGEITACLWADGKDSVKGDMDQAGDGRGRDSCS